MCVSRKQTSGPRVPLEEQCALWSVTRFRSLLTTAEGLPRAMLRVQLRGVAGEESLTLLIVPLWQRHLRTQGQLGWCGSVVVNP